MRKPGFDSQKYIRLQSEHIRERIKQFGGKLYLEFGGKLFDDYHASRVLPGFEPDNKIKMLLELKDQAEIVIAINANDIEKNKRRGDLGITYDVDVTRLIDIFRDFGLYVGSIALTQYAGQPSANIFESKMTKLGLKVYKLYQIPNYPSDLKLIVSDEAAIISIETYEGDWNDERPRRLMMFAPPLVTFSWISAHCSAVRASVPIISVSGLP